MGERLTRGCRAGGGVACSSLEYGGIRAAMRHTPAPRDRLYYSQSRLLVLHHLLLLLVLLFDCALFFYPLLLYSLGNIGAILLLFLPFLTATSSYPRTTVHYDNSDNDHVSPFLSRKALPAHCSSCKATLAEKMDRRKEEIEEDGKRGRTRNQVYPLQDDVLVRMRYILAIVTSDSAANFVDILAG